MGGTEATVVRVAQALGEKLDVTVAQHGRNEYAVSQHVTYRPLSPNLLSQSWDHIVCLRTGRQVPWLRMKHPGTPLYVWLHDLPGVGLREEVLGLAQCKAVLIAVSDYHKTIVQATFANIPLPPLVTRIYNPVDDALAPATLEHDPTRMVFFSSPHKGLEEALSLFGCVRRAIPGMRLSIANPGYFRFNLKKPLEGVEVLGSLPHHLVMHRVKRALCVFHPNHVFPETFGLVNAEALAVGTPVLAHALGATPEILGDTCPTIDTRRPEVVIDTIAKWRENRPMVIGNKEFKMSNVLKHWLKLFGVA